MKWWKQLLSLNHQRYWKGIKNMPIIKWLEKNLEITILAIMLATLTTLSFINVVSRYLFQSSIIWSEEVCRYCLVLSGFFSIPCWIRSQSGIRVDVFVQLLSKRIQHILNIFVHVFLLIFFIYLFINSLGVIKSISSLGQLTPTLRIPMKYLYVMVAIGFALSVIRVIQVLLSQIVFLPQKKVKD